MSDVDQHAGAAPGSSRSRGGFQDLLAREYEARERQRRYQRITQAVSFVTAVTGVLAGIFASYSWTGKSQPLSMTIPQLVSQQQIEETRASVRDLQTAVDRLQQSRLPPQDVSLARLASSIDRIDERLVALESVLVATPDKALAIPLLRKDFEASKEQHQRDMVAVSADVGRIYDMNKWIFGLIITSVLGLVLNQWLGRPAPSTGFPKDAEKSD